jgi:hypothetical protein
MTEEQHSDRSSEEEEEGSDSGCSQEEEDESSPSSSPPSAGLAVTRERRVIIKPKAVTTFANEEAWDSDGESLGSSDVSDTSGSSSDEDGDESMTSGESSSESEGEDGAVAKRPRVKGKKSDMEKRMDAVSFKLSSLAFPFLRLRESVCFMTVGLKRGRNESGRLIREGLRKTIRGRTGPGA